MTAPSSLAGKCIVVTRAEEQEQDLCRMLRARGAEPIEWPVLRIDAVAPDDPQRWNHAVAAADWIVFCSANGVKHALPQLASAWPASLRVAAVGPKTAQLLAAQGYLVDALPEIYQAANIVSAIRAVQPDLAGARVLVIKGALSPNELSESLRAAGAQVSELIVYQTGPVDKPAPLLGTFEAITFASGSAARFAAMALGPNLPESICVACIGPQTAQAARASGWTVTAQARDHTIRGMVDALEEHFRFQRPGSRLHTHANETIT